MFENLGITEYNQKEHSHSQRKEVNVRKNALNELSNVVKSEPLEFWINYDDRTKRPSDAITS